MGCQLRGPVVDVAVDRYFVYSLGEETVGKKRNHERDGRSGWWITSLVNSMAGLGMEILPKRLVK